MHNLKLLPLLLAFAGCDPSGGSTVAPPKDSTQIVGSWHNSRLQGSQFDSVLIRFAEDGTFAETAVFSQVGSYWQTVRSSGTWWATSDSLTMVTFVSHSTKDSGRTWKSLVDSAVSYTTAYSLVADSLYWSSWDTATNATVKFGLKRL